ncbi:MAG: hypothetical protein NVSMB51_13790 [Solirubrobacteraceae bacterium]
MEHGPVHDAHASAFRARMLRTGLWPSLFTSAYTLVYYALTPGGPHRAALVSIALVTAAWSLAMQGWPAEHLFASRWREAIALGWSASLIVVIAVAVALDGGIASPLAPLFFLPLVFAALSYPTKSVMATGVMTLAGYLTVLLAIGRISAGRALVAGCTLVTVTWICAWQARNHAAQREELSELSRADPLTGCLNRRGFAERFAAELADYRRHGRPLGFVLIDLDRFKAVNDTRGHAAGDELLCWVAERLRTLLRPSDALGRLGGDEFGLLLSAADSETVRITERLIAALAEHTGASAGVATFPADGDDEDTLHQTADADLYAAKLGGTARRSGELSWATALADIVDRRMGAPHEHSKRVAEYAAAIAGRLGCTAAEIEDIRLAAMLHDVGKADVPLSILRKSGPLDAAEFAEIVKHPAAGAEIVAAVGGLEAIAIWVRHSHERIDGAGYPDGLAGDAIPLQSRVLLVADAFDAMTSDRPYRQSMAESDAIQELRRNAGSQFDERCTAALIEHLEEQQVRPALGAGLSARPAR